MMIIAYQKKLHTELRKEIEPIMHVNEWIKKYTKMKIYMTLIRPVVTYVCETWTFSVQDINDLVFER